MDPFRFVLIAVAGESASRSGGINPGSLGGCPEAGGRPGRIRDLHPQQPRVHTELWGALPSGRDDQHSVCGIDDQSGGEPAFRQKATNAVDAEGRTPIVASQNEGVEQRIGGCIPTLVSAISH